jgi:hypothetical protein
MSSSGSGLEDISSLACPSSLLKGSGTYILTDCQYAFTAGRAGRTDLRPVLQSVTASEGETVISVLSLTGMLWKVMTLRSYVRRIMMVSTPTYTLLLTRKSKGLVWMPHTATSLTSFAASVDTSSRNGRVYQDCINVT